MFLVMEVIVEVIMERGQLNQDMVAMEVSKDMVAVTALMEVIVEVTMVRDLLSLDMVVIAEVMEADMDIAEDTV